MWNTGESLEGLKASWHVIPHVPDNGSLLPLCSDARWGYPQVCVKAGVYRQQGNCLSAPPLGDSSLLLWYDSISIFITNIWCPFMTPMLPPIFYASFIYQDSSIKAVYFYYAALTAQWSLCLCYGLSHQQRCLCSFIVSFTHSLDLSFYCLPRRVVIS